MTHDYSTLETPGPAPAKANSPKPGATVSMPLHWDEVKKGLKMKQFTLKNAMARIKSQGDIFNAVLKGSSVPKTLDL